MPNPVIDLMHKHGSVRHYLPNPVSHGDVAAIVYAAQRASTSSNLQMWTVIAVTDLERRRQLSELCGNQRHIVEAPVFLVWCADLARLDRACELRRHTQVTDYVENFLVAAADAAIGAQNAAVAAESLGLGICYIGGIRNRPADVIALLDMPKHTFPITGMTLGWPAANPPIRPRLATEAVLHWEHYDTTEQDRLLQEYDEAMIATGIYQGRQVAVPGTSGEMENYGWLEHSARRVSQPTRVGLREILEEQGFMLR